MVITAKAPEFCSSEVNSGAEPDDMISLRMWITKDRIYTARRRKLVTA